MNDSTERTTDTRTSEQGGVFEVDSIRDFLGRILADELLADQVNELIFEHVVAGRYHPSLVAESLRPIIEEALYTASAADWRAVAERLIAEARSQERDARP